MIANYAVGGVAWDYGQYALGLEHLGYEVYYLEDTGTPPYDPSRGEYGEDCSFAVGFLKRELTRLSPTLGQRWRYVNSDGRAFGISEDDFHALVRDADLFLNVSGSALMREAYLACPRRVFIDTDPGLNQLHNFPRWDANPGWLGTHGWRSHNFFFTYANRLGRPDCPLGDFGVPWHFTRPPVVLEEWEAPRPPGRAWTTVMTWKNFPKLIEHEGRTYGAKELEFPKIEAVPQRVHTPMEVAVGGNAAPREHWKSLGWHVRDSHAVTADSLVYRNYIFDSRGEFSVAKNIYVDTRGGWFSCRTVCYLAASRPAVVQDTGFSELLPCGEGLLAFTDADHAVAAIQEVESDYARHSHAARAMAERHFDSAQVLGEILDVVGLPRTP